MRWRSSTGPTWTDTPEQLVARGPTLSPDGTAHTGSVHVLEAPTIDDARRFATREPYHLAGLHASVAVTRFGMLSPGRCGIGRRLVFGGTPGQ
ncbi:MAG: hypothetical protein DLM59_06870 [Pseudonocardiales bacterium]|nr:MAG: hypothetical protein DLM59_06870 [Pseudonocardiales bacterium]